jgi:hypothetical protein
MENKDSQDVLDFYMSEEEFTNQEIIEEFNKSFDKVIDDLSLIYDKIDEIKEIEGDYEWPCYNNTKHLIK